MSEDKKRILILDDEEMIRDLLCETLRKKGYDVETCATGKEALKMIGEYGYDLLVTDLRLPDISGMEVMTRLKKKQSDIGIIMITAYGSIKNAVKAMQKGAFDYVTKPFDLDDIEGRIEKYFSYRSLVEENRYLKSELDRKFSFENIIGKCEPMERVFESIRMVARSKATVLIQGASGTGKELVARAIHYNSSRKDGPFITTNCAALPEGIVESELFGHEKGAFTGAIKMNKGRFEMADGGTILLDEVSEISLGMQSKLLRVIQEREIERVGGGTPIPVDVRIISTTNRDLQKEVEAGNFREDLFYRLNVVPIQLPSISERREDIPLLVTHFAYDFAEQNELPPRRVSAKALKLLSARDWPGNVREIEKTVERAVVMAPPEVEVLDTQHFMLQDSPMIGSAFSAPDSDMTLHDIEKSVILQKLKELDDNRTKTAEVLGISVRTLRNKLNEYRAEGISV